MKMMKKQVGALALGICLAAALQAQEVELPDYSYCGYRNSNETIPAVAVKAVVPVKTGQDRTADIQAAIDYVSSLPLDKNGFRGAVLLEDGQYEVSSTLWFKASGVVLRGSGHRQGSGTEILATATDKTTLIRVKGVDDRQYGNPIAVNDTALAMDNCQIHLAASALRAGDKVKVQRRTQAAAFGAAPRTGASGRSFGSFVASWEREIVSVRGNVYELDAPLSDRLRMAEVVPMTWEGCLSNVGIENVSLTSIYDKTNEKDENHCWIAVSLENVCDAWVRRVEFRHFAGSAVFIAETASRVTVEDCKSLEPVSEIGGQRRYTFYVKGSRCLLQRIQAEEGYHDFAVAGVSGPNAFVQCWSLSPYSYSGTVEAQSTGVLFDICAVDGNSLRFGQPNRANAFDGCTTSQSTMWNSQASIISCDKPMSGQNWAFGAWGGFNGKGYWNGANTHVFPWSLYYSQLEARKAATAADVDKLITVSRESATNAQIARRYADQSHEPLVMLAEWIDRLCEDDPLDLAYEASMKTVWQKFVKEKDIPESHPMVLERGVLVRDGKILTGSRRNPSWWRGDASAPATADPHLVRYALGPEGYGIVDDLDEMTDNMKRRHELVTDFNYALWYERRRDDHERIARIDGDVRPPLYELPFGRSGEGRAYDGLSKYDLTKWNNWYWNRLNTYAHLADQKNLVLFYQQYFQHNILEAGAHWADFPWRPTNNVNETDFPNPTPYAGNKRVFMAEHFYDETHPVRRELHRNYIRKCLESFSDCGSVIHFQSAELSGPLHFTQFWVDVIAEWERETGRQALVGLSAPKNVQDSILMDPGRSSTINVIDIRYWYQAGNGREFAPDGGLNLTPRQFERFGKPGSASDESVYSMVSRYRQAYPDKAVIYSAENYPERGWAALMAGASLCPLPEGLPEDFLRDAARASAVYGLDNWMLAAPGECYMVYPSSDGKVRVDLSAENGSFHAVWVDLSTGEPQGSPFTVKGGQTWEAESGRLLWLRR